MLDQFLRVTFSSGAGFTAEIDEVVEIVVALPHDVVDGVVEKGHEFIVETFAAFDGEFEVEFPKSAAEKGEPVIHVLAGGHPIGHVSLSF